MKKLFLILLAAIAVSCSKDDNFDSNEASKELIGIWKKHTAPEHKNDYYYEFREGFICYSYQTKKNSLEVEFSTMGGYSLGPNNTITITWQIDPSFPRKLYYEFRGELLYIGKGDNWTIYEKVGDLFD